jgi:glyoxylase-like metal-dependent hydrolase (beta-lactamase superfamily II)
MTKKIITGIHQLEVPIPYNPLRCTNDYLLQGNDGYMLIDTGVNSDEAQQALTDQLAEIGVSPRDISQIVITHGHRDHYGMVGRMKKITPAKVYLHYLDEQHIFGHEEAINEQQKKTERWLHMNGAPDDLMPSFMEGVRFMNLPYPDIKLQGGETLTTGIFNLQVIWTPGHSPGHVCLYEPDQKILFGGDHVLPVITPNISLHFSLAPNPLGDFIASLNRVKQLDVKLVLPAHEQIYTNLPKRVDEILHHHELRNAEILKTMVSGPKTAYQVASEITWMPELGGATFLNLKPGDKRMATSETMAHLEAMRHNGLISQFRNNSLIYYQRV